MADVDDFLASLEAEHNQPASSEPSAGDSSAAQGSQAGTVVPEVTPAAAEPQPEKRQRKKRKWDSGPAEAPAEAPAATEALSAAAIAAQMAMTMNKPAPPGGDPAVVAAQAAAAIAAAQLAAGGVMAGATGTGNVSTGPAETEQTEFVREITINDCKNRSQLTGSGMHREITSKTGAAVLCRGVYVPPGEKCPEGEKPLYLHVTGPSQTILEDATDLIKIKMNMQIATETEQAAQQAVATICEEKVNIELPGGPEVRHQYIGKILGPKGGNLRFVEQDTGARVKLFGREAHEVSAGVDAAKELLMNLIDTVKKEMETKLRTQAAMQPQYGGYGGYGGYGAPPPYGGYGGYGGYPAPYGAPPPGYGYGAPPGQPPPPQGQPPAPYGAPPGQPPPPGYGAPPAYPPQYGGYDYSAYGAPPPPAEEAPPGV